MKKMLLVILLVSTIFLNGCFSYIDINRVIFVTSLVIDVEKEGEVTVYVEAFHSFRSNKTNEEQGQRVFYKATGVTLFDAVRKLNNQASHKINYTQNKAIFFTKRAAEKGMTEFFDFIHRDQEFLLRTFILVLDGEPEEIYKVELKESDFLGLFLYDLLDNPATGAKRVHDKINQFLNSRLQGKRTETVGMVQVVKEELEEKIEVSGAAIISDDKMVGELDAIELLAYNFFRDIVDAGLVIYVNPTSDDDKLVVLEIIKSKTNSSLTFDGNKIYLKKDINVRTTFAESQGPITLDEKTLEELSESASQVIKKEIYELFNKYKEKDINIFEIQRDFDRLYPKAKIENTLAITELEVVVNVFIEGSTDIMDFR